LVTPGVKGAVEMTLFVLICTHTNSNPLGVYKNTNQTQACCTKMKIKLKNCWFDVAFPLLADGKHIIVTLTEENVNK